MLWSPIWTGGLPSALRAFRLDWGLPSGLGAYRLGGGASRLGWGVPSGLEAVWAEDFTSGLRTSRLEWGPSVRAGGLPSGRRVLWSGRRGLPSGLGSASGLGVSQLVFTRLRGKFAERDSHGVCPIRRAISSQTMEVFSEALITPAEGLRYPQRGHAPPFADP